MLQLTLIEYTIVSILGLSLSQEIDTVNTFGRQPLTPQMLSAFMVIGDQTWKYFAIRVTLHNKVCIYSSKTSSYSNMKHFSSCVDG